MTQNKSIKPAVGAVVFRGQEVLLVKRGRPPLQGHWSIPGGKIEFGEAAEDAVRREVMEEAGIEIEVIGLIDVFEALPQKDEGGHYIMIDYVARHISGEPVASDDAEEAAFLPFSEALSRLAWDQTRTALQQARLALRRAEERHAEKSQA
ncbi:NUDIX hydrolase [Parvularcula sp. IMCC14364]|uniref:NUDIX hydrolase n=1 Tax=Parvularcula sp. IMCC14364 TaxID=3067902 RepID=UPI0027403DC2|nr:NUDIX hydrolase [Parvularcula sp. IMCC14364]